MKVVVTVLCHVVNTVHFVEEKYQTMLYYRKNTLKVEIMLFYATRWRLGKVWFNSSQLFYMYYLHLIELENESLKS